MKRILPIALVLSIGGNIILFAVLFFRPCAPTSEAPGYPFLSKRIFSENQNDIIINFMPLRTALLEYSKKIKSRHGFYFEYLPSGVSIGINEKEPFILASLLKVPISIALHKEYEKGMLHPTDTIAIEKPDINAEYGTIWQKGVGSRISLQDLEKAMLTQSDNTASNMIFRNLPEASLDDIFDGLDVPKYQIDNMPIVTAKNYSSILRSLYLSSLVTKEHSNEILKLLSETPYKDKLDAGVPDTITVSHKIGDYISNDYKQRMLTDCGIIYIPKRPYIACAMVETTDEQEAKSIISTFSPIVYEYVTDANHQ